MRFLVTLGFVIAVFLLFYTVVIEPKVQRHLRKVRKVARRQSFYEKLYGPGDKNT